MWDELVCPFDHARLDESPAELTCRDCGREYPIDNGTPIFSSADRPWNENDAPANERGEAPQIYGFRPRRPGRELQTILSRFVSLGPRSRILLVGPCANVDLRCLAGRQYVVDPIASRRGHTGRLGRDGLRWIAARGEALPFAGGSFDAVVLADMLQWTQTPQRVLGEASRILAADGVLWLSSQVATGQIRRPFRPHAVGAGRDVTRGKLLHDCRAAGLTPLWTPADDKTGLEARHILPFGRHEIFEGVFGLAPLKPATSLAMPVLAAA